MTARFDVPTKESSWNELVDVIGLVFTAKQLELIKHLHDGAFTNGEMRGREDTMAIVDKGFDRLEKAIKEEIES